MCYWENNKKVRNRKWLFVPKKYERRPVFNVWQIYKILWSPWCVFVWWGETVQKILQRNKMHCIYCVAYTSCELYFTMITYIINVHFTISCKFWRHNFILLIVDSLFSPNQLEKIPLHTHTLTHTLQHWLFWVIKK